MGKGEAKEISIGVYVYRKRIQTCLQRFRPCPDDSYNCSVTIDEVCMLLIQCFIYRSLRLPGMTHPSLFACLPSIASSDLVPSQTVLRLLNFRRCRATRASSDMSSSSSS